MGKEESFIQIGSSLLLSKKFQALSYGARVTYFAMMMESGGKRRFIFPAEIMDKYGLPMRSCRRHIYELINSGFIRCVYEGKEQMNPNEYEFVSD